MNIILRYILVSLLYLFCQINIFNHLTLFRVATPFIFLLFLFTLPFNTSAALLYITAFSTGLLVDILSEGAATGLHAFSCLLAISLRGPLIGMISSSNFRNPGEISLTGQSSIWYMSFLLPLIFIHHLAYFFLEALSLQAFLYTLLKVVASTAYTFMLCYILAYVFYKR